MNQQTNGSGDGNERLGIGESNRFTNEQVKRRRNGDVGERRRNAGTLDCQCEVSVHGDQLLVDAERCPGRGRLAVHPACRETVIRALSVRDAASICTRVDDRERACASETAGFLLAAGRFTALCGPHDETLATRARRDPLRAARLAVARSDVTTRIAAETGLVEGAMRFADYRDAFGDPDGADAHGASEDPNRTTRSTLHGRYER